MARTGRPSKPTKLKLLEGNPGKRPINQNEPKPKPISPDCPKWLAPEAKKLWKKLMPELERLGLMTIVDGTAFEAVCQEYSTWVQCEKVLKKDGLTFEINRYNDEGEIISTYVQQRPEVAIANKALANVKSFMTEFGLTPASRCRLNIKSEAGKDDPMERLLGGG